MVPDRLKEEQRILVKIASAKCGLPFWKTNQTLPPSQHVERVSDELAILADELSRKTVTSNQKAAWTMKINWLSNPETGGKLCKRLLDEC